MNPKLAALKEIRDIAFHEMESCNEPYFSAFDEICTIYNNVKAELELDELREKGVLMNTNKYDEGIKF